MEIETKSKGKIQIEEDKIYETTEGLYGFEDYHKFALVNSDYEPFIWLQSLDTPDLAFLIVDPFLICDYYETDIDDESLKKIGVQKPEDLVIMTIVTIPSDGSAITANFQGPLVINKNTKQFIQVILQDNKWSTKVNIIEALGNKGGK